MKQWFSLFSSGIDIHPESSGAETSIVFISLHKCATTFFSHHVFKELDTLKLVDYQSYEYTHDPDIRIKPLIRPKGYIYAVLRLYDRDHPGYALTKKLLSVSRLKKTKTIFWVRDPRDILVSLYYSFGFSHPVSPNRTIAEHQLARREKIRKLSLDEYVLQEAPNLRWKFETLDALMRSLPNHLFLKYETMIEEFNTFFDALSAYTGLDAGKHDDMFDATRPQASEDINSHKRSGRTGAYAEKLKPDTVAKLDEILAPVLKAFGYTPYTGQTHG